MASIVARHEEPTFWYLQHFFFASKWENHEVGQEITSKIVCCSC